MIAIGIDIGGTQIKATAIDLQGHVLTEQTRPTNDGDGSVWKGTVAGLLQEICDDLQATDFVVGLSAPGLPDAGNQCILSMPGRMQGLEHFSWSDWLKKPTYVLNDALAALLGEVRYGIAKGKRNVVMLTLGTGVGGALLIEGRPYQGHIGKAGHIGHMVVDSRATEVDVTGMPGSLETCIGDYTIAQRSKGRFQSTQALVAAAGQGDGFAEEVWLASIKHLALSIASVSNILSPELVVLGGGITAADDLLFGPLREMIARYEWQPYGKPVEVVRANYGGMAGAIGAACFAMDKVTDKLLSSALE